MFTYTQGVKKIFAFVDASLMSHLHVWYNALCITDLNKTHKVIPTCRYCC